MVAALCDSSVEMLYWLYRFVAILSQKVQCAVRRGMELFSCMQEKL